MAIATAWPEARGQNRPCRGIIPPLLRSWSVRGRRARMAWIAERRRQSRVEAVVLPHLDVGYALARWLTRNNADAADVVQEACLRAFRYFDSYREGDAKSWFLKIVRRKCYRPAASSCVRALSCRVGGGGRGGGGGGVVSGRGGPHELDYRQIAEVT